MSNLDGWHIITEDDIYRAYMTVLEYRLNRLWFAGITKPQLPSPEAMLEYRLFKEELLAGDTNGRPNRGPTDQSW